MPETAKLLAILGGPPVLLLAAVLLERRRNEVQEWHIDYKTLLRTGVLTQCRRSPRGQPGGSPPVGDVLIALSYLGGAGLWTYLAR